MNRSSHTASPPLAPGLRERIGRAINTFIKPSPNQTNLNVNYSRRALRNLHSHASCCRKSREASSFDWSCFSSSLQEPRLDVRLLSVLTTDVWQILAHNPVLWPLLHSGIEAAPFPSVSVEGEVISLLEQPLLRTLTAAEWPSPWWGAASHPCEDCFWVSSTWGKQTHGTFMVLSLSVRGRISSFAARASSFSASQSPSPFHVHISQRHTESMLASSITIWYAVFTAFCPESLHCIVRRSPVPLSLHPWCSHLTRNALCITGHLTASWKIWPLLFTYCNHLKVINRKHQKKPFKFINYLALEQLFSPFFHLRPTAVHTNVTDHRHIGVITHLQLSIRSGMLSGLKPLIFNMLWWCFALD